MSAPTRKKMVTVIVIVLMAASAGVSLLYFKPGNEGEAGKDSGVPAPSGGETPPTGGDKTIPAVVFPLTGSQAEFTPASDIFAINGTTGRNGGVKALINLMGEHGLLFYKSSTPGKNCGPAGLIAANDVVLIKVNCQWNQRGGTSTDLLSELIQAIIDHPDGFSGEIVVADNGEAQGGSSGNGGSLDWAESNAEDHSQSSQKVVDSFSGTHRVSTYLWDTITATRVDEYSEGDSADGYIVNATKNPRTGIMVSYPKFKTEYGTYISFKHGIWDTQTGTYDGGRLKVINVPVLKTHIDYGVTGCVKHYMGVTSDILTRDLGARTHTAIRRGALGTEMIETRFPVLNILDAIWVNPIPLAGPLTSYQAATRLNVIMASRDLVALDYWASKHILLASWKARSGEISSSINPDNLDPGSFGDWLRLSMYEIIRGGYQATVDESRMNIYVAEAETI